MADLTDRTDDITIWNEARTLSADLMTDVDGRNRLSVETVPSILTPSAQNISQLVRAGKVYCYADAVSAPTSGSSNPIFLLKNPNGSGKTFYIYKVIANLNVVNVGVKFSVYANPTITGNGTSVTPVNRSIGGGFGASASTAFKSSTVSAPGTLVYNVNNGQNCPPVNLFTDCGIILAANNNLLFTADPASNNREVDFTIVWVEL